MPRLWPRPSKTSAVALRWHPQLSGASFFGSDFIGDVLQELDRDLGVDVRRRPLLVISVIGVQSSGKSTLTGAQQSVVHCQSL